MWLFDKILGKLILPLRAPARFGVRLKRKHRIRRFEKSARRSLEIGGGRYPLSSHRINVDGLDAPEVDVVHNFPEPMPFPAGHVDEIITSAMLEHFHVLDVRRLLGDFHRVLKPGGALIVAVPALDKILRCYEKEGCTDRILRYLHGGQKDEHDIHLSVLDTNRWLEELRDAGFVGVESVDYDLPLHDADCMAKLRAKKSEARGGE